MNIHLRIRNVPVHPSAEALFQQRVRAALDRFQLHIRSVEVRLEDINGPTRGGDDKRCQIDVTLRNGGLLFCDALGRSVLGVVDEASERAARLIRDRLRRGVSGRRGRRFSWPEVEVDDTQEAS